MRDLVMRRSLSPAQCRPIPSADLAGSHVEKRDTGAVARQMLLPHAQGFGAWPARPRVDRNSCIGSGSAGARSRVRRTRPRSRRWHGVCSASLRLSACRRPLERLDRIRRGRQRHRAAHGPGDDSEQSRACCVLCIELGTGVSRRRLRASVQNSFVDSSRWNAAREGYAFAFHILSEA